MYFFYRPRVEQEDVHSIDDIQRSHILLIPRPPEFANSSEQPVQALKCNKDDEEMALLEPGADAAPATETTNQKKKHFRMITIGKKRFPDPGAGGGKGGGRKNTFWATISTVGDDLKRLADGLGPKEYETKTRGEANFGFQFMTLKIATGTRHQGPARLAARGAYAFVNAEAPTPSKRETHLGYHLSHPTPENLGEVHAELGIYTASSFVVQIKNPLAPPTGDQRVGLPSNRRADFPEDIMTEVFGKGGSRGRESFGLRFASVERSEMLNYEGTELLLIAARGGEKGLETSLEDGRGAGMSKIMLEMGHSPSFSLRAALKEIEEIEGNETVKTILKELGMEKEKILVLPLEGQWL